MTQRNDRTEGAGVAADSVALTGLDAPDPSRRFVRVTGRRGALVEFEFAVGDPALHVDLVLPETHLAEFCRANAAVMLQDGRAPDAHDWSMRRAALGAVPGEDIER
jgi:phenol hydroxylase P0 protein